MVRVVNLRKPGRGPVTKVDRTTIFGNPVKLGKTCPECGAIHVRDPQMKAMVCYGRYLIRRLDADAPFAVDVRTLAESKRLGCWCAPAPCHVDILAVYLNHESIHDWHEGAMRKLIAHVDAMELDATRQVELF